MAEPVQGIVRRIDYEPKKDFLEYRSYAHIFLKTKGPGGPDVGDDQIDFYTDNPRLEAAILSAYELQQYIEITYEEVDAIKVLTRVILDQEFQE